MLEAISQAAERRVNTVAGVEQILQACRNGNATEPPALPAGPTVEQPGSGASQIAFLEDVLAQEMASRRRNQIRIIETVGLTMLIDGDSRPQRDSAAENPQALLHEATPPNARPTESLLQNKVPASTNHERDH